MYVPQLALRFGPVAAIPIPENIGNSSQSATSEDLALGSVARRLYKNSPGPLWRSAGGETAGICVELYSVEVPSLGLVFLMSICTKGGITSWIARWVSSSGLHPTRVLPERHKASG